LFQVLEILLLWKPGDNKSSTKDCFDIYIYIIIYSHYILLYSEDVIDEQILAQIVPEALLSWIRARVANQLATSGTDWAELFSLYHSGTCNLNNIIKCLFAHFLVFIFRYESVDGDRLQSVSSWNASSRWRWSLNRVGGTTRHDTLGRSLTSSRGILFL
jgi:hypothetical protein